MPRSGQGAEGQEEEFAWNRNAALSRRIPAKTIRYPYWKKRPSRKSKLTEVTLLRFQYLSLCAYAG